MRLAFLLPAFDIGGAERVALRTAARLDPARYDTALAAFVRGSGRLLAEAQRAGVRTIVLSPVRGRAISLVRSLFGWLQRERPDVLFTMMFHANVAGRLAGRLAGVPVIVSSERVVGWESRGRILVNRLTARLATALTTNSEAGRLFWARRLGVPCDKVHVLYNGVDTGEFVPAPQPLARDRVLIGVLARLHRANGHQWFLQALAALARRPGPAWRCVLSGDGEERERLLARAADLGLGERVVFAGHTTNPPAFLQSLDVYAHPALVAGMPNAVLEAMASGLPVVATDVGGTREAVCDGETGWLVEPGDVDRMTDRLHALVADPARRARFGHLGRARAVERFSVESMVARVDSLLTTLLESATRGKGVDQGAGTT